MIFPFHSLVFAYITPPALRSSEPRRFDALLFRRTERFPRPGGDLPDPPAPVEAPLTPTERALYIGFACWVGMTFFALFALVLFMHSPGNAN